MNYLPELKAVLISLSQEMKSVDDFSSICGGAVMPDVLARKWWITPLRETQWCFLARVCQKAAMSIDVQQSMERFTNIARDSQYSRIIRVLTALWSRSVRDDPNWLDLLSYLESR